MSPNGIIRIFICLATLASATLVSCRRTGHEEPVPGTGTERPDDVRVSFRIALGSTNGTRAGGTPEGSYDDGTQSEFENGIDLENGNYRFFFSMRRTDTSPRSRPWSLSPKERIPTGRKRMKWSGKRTRCRPRISRSSHWRTGPPTPENDGGRDDDRGALHGGKQPLHVLRTVRTVPRTADSDVRRKSCEEMTFTPGMLTHLGTVHLLRAMAKVEVSCKTSGWTLEKVELLRYNATGYCAPSGVYSQDDYVKGNYAGDYTDTVHLPDGRNDEAPKTRAFDRTADGRFVAYVPEYRNVAAGTANRKAADAAEMRVRFKEAPGKEYAVEFKYYNAPPEGSAVGDPFDIRRNYYYKFSISKTSEPDLVVEVFPYELVELDPGFGLLP